jgi:hypothetical protein
VSPVFSQVGESVFKDIICLDGQVIHRYGKYGAVIRSRAADGAVSKSLPPGRLHRNLDFGQTLVRIFDC